MSVDHQNDIPYNPHKKLQLSCAECRRLKLKCSRVWPCTSCQKRGLSNICPNGALATRPRVKQTQSIPQHVVDHIHLLQGRISQLERSLASVTADGTISAPTAPPSLETNQNMPYLQRKLMRKKALERAQTYDGDFLSSISQRSSDESEVDNVSLSLGTLKIAPDGRSVFFGPTAVTEGLSFDDDSSTEDLSDASNYQPPDIAALAQCFPFASASATVTELQERAKSHLPSLTRARELCTSYFTYATFVIDTVPEDGWFETLFQRLYGAFRLEIRSSTIPADEYILDQWHLVQGDELALFFCVIALGALTDLSNAPFNHEAEQYYNIVRALMRTENVLTEPTICSVQTLCLASYYEGLQSQRNSSRNCWAFMMLASKTAHIMGLHRDQLSLEEGEMQKRRLVFWEVHSMDMIQSLALGRPMSTPPNYMDTRIPAIDKHARVDATGQVEESFYRWKYRFCAQVLTLITDHVLRVKIPNYAATLETDRRISQFSSTFGRTHTKHSTPLAAAQLQMMLGTRETCIMYIHRGFFAQAISSEPDRPEHGKYSRSVLRTFEGACIIIQGMHTFVTSHAKFAARIWFLWNHLVTATFVVASIAIRATRSSLATTAFKQLDVVDQILKQTAIYGGRPKFMQPIIQSLRQKANNSRIDVHNGSPSQQTSSSGSTAEENDELAVIGGKTRVLVTRPSSRSPRSGSGSTASTPPSNVNVTVDQPASGDTGLYQSPEVVRPENQSMSHTLPSQPPIINHPPYAVSGSYGNAYSEYAQSNHPSAGNQELPPAYPPYNAYEYHQDLQNFDHTQYPHNPMDQSIDVSTDNGYSQRSNPTGNIYHLEAMPSIPLSQSFDETMYMSNEPHPSTMDGSAHLWHAMIQDLGIGNI
ncbi:hypothetical protein M422DRAFT_774568 [Sphaerobolus stellatus SS14]|nr:hypothetical protein M422DRAFT_774568 [Sphaerobolus stellatus SS14]